MNIVAAPADVAGCGAYRIIWPYAALRSRGHTVEFTQHISDDRIRRADVLVIQRAITPQILELVGTVQAMGVNVVYELDDNIHTLSGANPHSRTYGSGKPSTKMAERIMAKCDMMIVSTEDMADAYRRYQPNIVVCHNCLADAEFERMAPRRVTSEFREENQVRIGWAGSNSHRGDLALVVPVLTDLMRENKNVCFVTLGEYFGSDFPEDVRSRVLFCGGTNTTKGFDFNDLDRRLFGVSRYYDLLNLANFDIAIAPIEHTTFNRCKSDLKLLEMGALGVPVVASRFGPYTRYQATAPHKVAILADTEREWAGALRLLVESPEIRRRLAERNLEHIRKYRLLSRGVEAWESALLALPVRQRPEPRPEVVPMQVIAEMVRAARQEPHQPTSIAVS